MEDFRPDNEIGIDEIDESNNEIKETNGSNNSLLYSM